MTSPASDDATSSKYNVQIGEGKGIVIGDNPQTDALGAARLGMRCILVGEAREAQFTSLTALLEAVNKSRPANVKGIYLKKVSVSSTMGPGVRVDTTGMGGAGAAPH